MCVELRYFAKEDLYYIRVQEKEYFQLENKIKRLRREIGRIRDTSSGEYLNLDRKLRKLKEEKDNHQFFVPIDPLKLPENMNARPIYHKPLRLMSASGNELKKLFKETS